LAALGINVSSGSTSSGSESSNQSVILIARLINGEARGEPYEGQVAVGAVVLNRTRDPRFPSTVPGVIYQPGAFTAIVDGQIHANMEQSSINAARDALNGWDPSDGAIYYFNPATATSSWIWSRPLIKIIGKHRFCR
jgi:N-acetylmuramoyl-L-alanine amidase